MLELAWKGERPVQLDNGTERNYIEDHDTVILRGYCKNKTVRIGFGEVRTKLLPAQ
jgi:fumarylacetoacetase